MKAIATKTLPAVRFHLNGQYTFGNREPARDRSTVAVGRGGAELSRWFAGLAVDHTVPLRSLLVTGELVARRPLADAAAMAWHTAGGVRYQVAPRLAVDGGGGYRLTGDDEGWFLTFGAAVAVGLPWSGR